MRVDVAWWHLDGTPQTIESMREHLRDHTLDRWTQVPGLRLKIYFADQEQNRWGAVMLWETDERPPLDELPPNAALALIGRPPDIRATFQAEGTVEGLHDLASLQALGPAFAGTALTGTSVAVLTPPNGPGSNATVLSREKLGEKPGRTKTT
ncbi:hypothetical protein [Streptomyces atriruber]|uniref:hypothetical protein n=1 Tax=Streptomyces atriruber TaxID=545121 RepID=UPI0007C640A2|nr:hypothetical protein [Streptomyces atriruber]